MLFRVLHWRRSGPSRWTPQRGEAGSPSAGCFENWSERKAGALRMRVSGDRQLGTASLSAQDPTTRPLRAQLQPLANTEQSPELLPKTWPRSRAGLDQTQHVLPLVLERGSCFGGGGRPARRQLELCALGDHKADVRLGRGGEQGSLRCTIQARPASSTRMDPGAQPRLSRTFVRPAQRRLEPVTA